MNTTQVTTTFGPIIAFFAGLLAGKGVFGWDAMTWTTVIGGVVGAAVTIWGAFFTKASQVAAVAKMPEVTSIHLDPAQPGTANLNAATPNNVKTP